MTQPLTLITGNEGKLREFKELIGVDIVPCKIDLPEIQALDVAEVVQSKAAAAYDAVGGPVLVDDTGLTVHAWGEYPGALVKWIIKEVGPSGFLAMAESVNDRKATATTAIGYCDAVSVQVFVGRLDGELTRRPRGANGFGWDSIFQPAGELHTYAEMDSAFKNEISHRRKAADKLREALADTFPDMASAVPADECDGDGRPADR